MQRYLQTTSWGYSTVAFTVIASEILYQLTLEPSYKVTVQTVVVINVQINGKFFTLAPLEHQSFLNS